MTNESDRAVDTEMNTGVSDTDVPSPQQVGGPYLTGETTEATRTGAHDPEMNTGDSDTDVPSPQQVGGPHRSDLDPDDGGTIGDGQIDAAATSPSDDTPTDDRSAL